MSKIKILPILSTVFLSPISILWENIYRVRRFSYNFGIFSRNEFKVPIISIGNLTFGGTGKTPFTLWLSDYLYGLDKKVMILTRGYKGKLEHKSGILKSDRRLGYNPMLYGDEPMLLARRLTNASIVVGKNRSENLKHYFESEKPDVVLLDDGHQHSKLARNVNIVLFDSLMSLQRYKVAPKGYMREGFSALKDADLVVLGRCDQASSEQKEKLKKMILEYNPRIPFAEISYLPTGLFDSNYEKALELDQIANQNVICIAGIASPGSFYNSIENLGAKIVHKETFPDHHYFTTEEIDRLIQLAKKENAIIITTEKDIVKIRKISDASEIYYLEIKVNFMNGKEQTQEIISKAFLSAR